MHAPMRVQRQTITFGNRFHPLGEPGQVERLVEHQSDVFGNRQRLEQRKVLEHHADAQTSCLGRIVDVDFLAVEKNLSFIGLDRTVDDFHQGALASAIFAQYGVDFPRHDREADPVVGDDVRIALGDVEEFESGWGCAHARR